jgi:hypothetical protein
MPVHPVPNLPALALVLLAACCAWSRPVHAVPLAVAYAAWEEETTWEPIALEDVARVVEQAALEELTRSGALQLTRIEPRAMAALKAGYLLRITGRLLDETHAFTALLGFEGLDQRDLGSLRAADSVALEGLDRPAILRRIDQCTRRAARQLLGALEPALARRQAALTPPPDLPAAPPPLPWAWSEVKPPPSSLPSARELRHPDSRRRAAALRQLQSAALGQAAPRQALEECTLVHPDAGVRLACLVALRPLSRRLVPTQRVVIEVVRRDSDQRVLEEASDQLLYVTGVSRAEAVQAWLERTARDGRALGPLARLGDVPNLDLVIRACLWNARDPLEPWLARRSCLELLTPVPYARRLAILWPYLRELDAKSPWYLVGAGEREGSMGTEWQWALDAVADVMPELPPALEEALWQRYRRTLSEAALDVLVGHCSPTQANAGRLVEVVQSAGSRQALHALTRLGSEDPALSGPIREKLAEVLALGTYNKAVSARDLQDALRKLEGGRP